MLSYMDIFFSTSTLAIIEPNAVEITKSYSFRCERVRLPEARNKIISEKYENIPTIIILIKGLQPLKNKLLSMIYLLYLIAYINNCSNATSRYLLATLLIFINQRAII